MQIEHEYITDVFLERLEWSEAEKKRFFNVLFKQLFWIRFNTIKFLSQDYAGLLIFLKRNSKDVNRIFIENCDLGDEFFE
jgi:hypothetical protein